MRKHARLRARSVGASCAVLVVLLGACSARPGNNSGGGGSYVSQVTAQGTAHWTCASQGLGGNMEGEHTGDGTGLANDFYAGKAKGTLSRADCLANAATYDRVLRWALQFPTISSAESRGYSEMVQYIEGMGTHHMTGSLGGPNVNPFFLQYDGEAASAPLAGMSWFQMSGNRPPAGFAGDNDWWHSHTTLCYAGRGGLDNLLPGAPSFGVAGNEISDADCRAKGGFQLRLPGIWMGHAWIVPGYEDKFDVFAGASACVNGTGKPAANDPCHTTGMEEHHNHGGGGMTTTTRRAGGVTTRPVTTRPGVTTRRAQTTTTMMDHDMGGGHQH